LLLLLLHHQQLWVLLVRRHPRGPVLLWPTHHLNHPALLLLLLHWQGRC
jgi:hypothetical protein